MKNTPIKYYSTLIVLIFSGWFFQVHSQTKMNAKLAVKLVEKPVLITDREIYCVEEKILFSAFNVSSSLMREVEWSNILYVELVAPDGETFARKKIVYDQTGATGFLRLPNTLLTGNYYLRAYTRWMRDYSTYHYFYKMVKVINPFRAELLEPSGNKTVNEAELKTQLVNTNDLSLIIGKKNYQKREQVNLEIALANFGDFAEKFAVSVIPKGTEVPLVPNLSHLQEQKFAPYFIPETRGLSISGKVVNQADSLPLPFTLVGLTIFNENQENLNILTNEIGQFFFDLSKLKGEYEIFITAKPKEKLTPLILVDNDFSTQALKLPYVPMDFSEESKKVYETLMFNSQIHALYLKKEIENEMKAFTPDSSFYGTPDFVLKMSHYIALDNLKNYIQELLPQVAIRHMGKKTVLKVLGPYAELSIFEPLVLVDMVPIFDMDKILALHPEKIDRFEIISTPYVRGDIVFGGIISLFSKNGDLAGIDLPSTGRFIAYEMLENEKNPVVPYPASKRVPNVRNCLYWNPALTLNEKATANISFNCGDSSGDYLIIVSGVDKTGNTKVATSEITVE